MPRHSIELGWMNIVPCTKTVWTPTSIPGISTPTLKMAEQRLSAYAELDTDELKDEALAAAKDCAIAAIAAAGGLSAITSNPGAQPRRSRPLSWRALRPSSVTSRSTVSSYTPTPVASGEPSSGRIFSYLAPHRPRRSARRWDDARRRRW